MKRKPFEIDKRLVFNAWLAVKRAGGGPGCDDITIEQYEQDLKTNLYKLWNRMSSGSYFPKPVRQVAIPKKSGGERLLGIPTVEDRIAQTVVKMTLEPKCEAIFVEDSFGSRPGKSAIAAVKTCSVRCKQFAWVIDIDIRRYFDEIPHDLLLRAVDKHASHAWEKLYVRRWLTAPVLTAAGELKPRNKGTPQGATISPLLANLYLHYGLDTWLQRKFNHVPFERYLDDAIIHCKTYKQAVFYRDKIAERFQEIGLELHPEKTKIVRCALSAPFCGTTSFERRFCFLGFEFRPRIAKNPRDGEVFTAFYPAVGREGKKSLSQFLKNVKLKRKVNLSMKEIADIINPRVRGWMEYFKHFTRSALHRSLVQVNTHILKWMMAKYKIGIRSAMQILARVCKQQPALFAHWSLCKMRA